MTKTCRCCNRTWDERTWERLEYVGVQDSGDDDKGAYPDLELRNCLCGSTLAKRLQ